MSVRTPLNPKGNATQRVLTASTNMKPHGTCRPNRASKSTNHYMSCGWGPIETLVICLSATVGMCAERHSVDSANMSDEVTDGVQPPACPRDMPLHCRRQPCDHYRVSVCNGWEASSCAFRPRVKGVAKLLAQMPTVTARSKPRTKAVLSPRWGLGVENQVGPKHCGRPLGGAHHDEGEAVARKRRQRLLEPMVEQGPPKPKQRP